MTSHVVVMLFFGDLFVGRVMRCRYCAGKFSCRGIPVVSK